MSSLDVRNRPAPPLCPAGSLLTCCWRGRSAACAVTTWSAAKGLAAFLRVAENGADVGIALDGDGDRLKLHAKLGSLSGERSLLDADYTIKSDGFLLLAAAHTEGSVIVAVQCHGKGKAKKSG